MTVSMFPFSRRFPIAPVVAAVLLSLCCIGCSREEQATHEEIITAEFEAILELQDQACSGVVSYEKVEELDYRVVCVSGEIYRVHVSHEGQVNVQPHTP